MEPNTDIAGTALYTAAETGRALLDAMDAEEPFRLLSTIPGRLRELCTIGGRRESTAGRLVENVVLTQSKNHDSISSGVSRIHEWREEVGSLLDLRVHHLQCKTDDIQELLEGLHDNHPSDTFPRRSRAQEKLSRTLSNQLSKLQDTSERIRDISRYLCGIAEGLATDKQRLYHLIHQITHEIGLAQGGRGICERDRRPPAHMDITDPELGEERTPNRMRDMERRCNDVEMAVIHNNEVIARQAQEIDRLRRIIFHQEGWRVE